MIKWIISFFPRKLKRGDWLIYVNDLDTDFKMCTASLKYNQVVQLLEIKYSGDLRIVDVGIRFTDPTTFSLNSKTGCYVPGQGIRWLKLNLFRVATNDEVDRWMSENNIEYKRDKKLNQILNK